MIVTHERTGRPFATKYAQSVFGRDRETIEEAYPGDVVGLVNASNLTVGDTLFDPEGAPVRFPAMPAFAPEHFAVASVRDPGRSKQFRKAIEQLEQEGVVQVLVSESRGDASPILAAVGPLQFEVAQFRMEHEFGAPMRMDTMGLSLARLVKPEDLDAVRASHIEVVRRRDGAWLALLRDIWHARGFERSHPDIQLISLDASED
jgi:peptide chain release factor 3